MTRLRMKASPDDVQETLKSERRQRKKRRREERSTQHDNLDLGYDESSLPPDQAATKRAKDRQEDQDFNDKLHSAMEEDQGVGFYQESLYRDGLPLRWRNESASFSYSNAAGIAMGINNNNQGYGMDEEEYEEYIRAGRLRWPLVVRLHTLIAVDLQQKCGGGRIRMK
jgi:hypothetical protein